MSTQASNATEEKNVNAIELLKADHRAVERLFKQWEKATSADEKVRLACAICQALAVHAAIKEQVFYPAARGVLGAEGAMVDEAVVEHGSLKDLMKKLRGLTAADPLFTAHLTVLKEYVQHHVEEEETEFFPSVTRRGLNLEDVGAQLTGLKERLMKRASAPSTQRVTFFLPSGRGLPAAVVKDGHRQEERGGLSDACGSWCSARD